MKSIATSESATPLAPWIALVRKDGVGLGVLRPAQQRLALALVWSALPQDGVMSEPQVNQCLKRALAGAALCLATDHVELRRWLVDAGWLQRDSFCREYRVLRWNELTPELQAAAAPLRGLDSTAWVAGQRGAALAERQARRTAWQAAQTSQAT